MTAAGVTDMKLWLPLVATITLVALLLFLAKVPLGYNVRNLVVRWRVTLMTALAFTLVVAMLTVMLAFVNGMYRLTENSGQPGNVIVMKDGATDELFSNLGRQDVKTLAHHADVTPRVLRVEREGQETPLISYEIYIVVNQPVPVAPEQDDERLPATAIAPPHPRFMTKSKSQLVNHVYKAQACYCIPLN